MFVAAECRAGAAARRAGARLRLDPALRLGIHQDRGGGEQAEQSHRVVLRVAGLVEQQHVRVHDQRQRENRDRPGSVGPREYPRSEQAQDHPADVEERREEVVAEEQDPRGVEELGVLRVEPDGDLEHFRVVERADLSVLHEARGERCVVPSRVRQVHPDVQARLRGHRPMSRDQQRRGDGQGHRDRGHRRCRKRNPLFPAAEGQPDPDPREEGRGQDPPGLVQADDADQLQDHDQQRESQDHLGQACRRAGPARQEPTAKRHGAVAHRRGDGDQLDGALEKVPEAHAKAASPSFSQASGSSGPSMR